MDKEWKPEVGNVVWAKGVVADLVGGYVPSYKVSFGGDEVWFKSAGIRPDDPTPAEMDDVAVLRRAVSILKDESNSHAGANAGDYLTSLANEIEAARRAPTLLEALKALDMMLTAQEPGGPDAPCLRLDTAQAWAATRRAIAAAEEKGDK